MNAIAVYVLSLSFVSIDLRIAEPETKIGKAGDIIKLETDLSLRGHQNKKTFSDDGRVLYAR